MKTRTDFHSVNLSTGERTRSIVGDGQRIDEVVGAAATQEPAGSGASEQRIQELAMVLAKRVLRVTRVDITSADSEEKARELLTLLVGPQSGSPRKVGEDGAAADRAYCDYVDQLRRPECLGYEQKLKEGKFGKAELDAHVRAGELLGRHRALAEVVARPSSVPVGEQK